MNTDSNKKLTWQQKLALTVGFCFALATGVINETTLAEGKRTTSNKQPRLSSGMVVKPDQSPLDEANEKLKDMERKMGNTLHILNRGKQYTDPDHPDVVRPDDLRKDINGEPSKANQQKGKKAVPAPENGGKTPDPAKREKHI